MCVFGLTNCTIALPEFQTAESLQPQEYAGAVGGYSGRGLNASTGGLGVMNYGITEQLDLTSSLSISRLNIEQDNIRISMLAGPKWSTKSGTWAHTRHDRLIFGGRQMNI